jgi:hypothetical protein
MPGQRLLALKRPDQCVHCGTPLPIGQRAWWDPAARTVTCQACAAEAGQAVLTPEAAPTEPAVVAGVAGASAKQEFQRRHDARMRRARERYGPLGAGVAWLVGDPQSTSAWRRGAEGEEKVAHRLEKHLRGKQVKMLHDRLLPGSRQANIDHVAVGPGGVTVIDSKNLTGKVRLQSTGGLFSQRTTTLRVGGSNRTKLVRGVERQAEAVRSLLQAASLHVEVRAALCMASTDGLPLLSRLELDGVLIAGPAAVAKLAARAGTLGEAECRRILQELSSGLRLAAGAC